MENQRNPTDPNWRTVSGFDGYEINRMGEIRSWRPMGREKERKEPHMLTPYRKNPKFGSWYMCVHLMKDGKRTECKMSQLVAEAWLGPRPEGAAVWHKNGDKADDCANNLEYITMEKLGQKTGAKSGRRPVAKIDRDGNVIEFYSSVRRAAAAHPVSYQWISDRCKGKVRNEFEPQGYSFRWDI